LLKPVLITWKGQPLAANKQAILALGFANSKFFNYAAYVIDELKKKNISIYKNSSLYRMLRPYAAYINAIQKVNDQIYPQVANGKTKYEDRIRYPDEQGGYAALE